ncbi:hypothetical protein V8J82_09270 [Gymnodinialimonas sp. 2305UL16-5]|uniref:hypothetical protein n=1 Tax=Gymnodinialimonas mytili TaxID=3126503 RepID=UPI0030ACB6D6
MDFLFAYDARLLTLIDLCVLPVLPIVLAGSLQSLTMARQRWPAAWAWPSSSQGLA